MEIQFTTASGMEDFEQILQLQKENMRLSKSALEEQEQGFVTVKHDLSILAEMNIEAQHIIAKDGNEIIGYALAMTRNFKDKIPILKSMFELLDNLEYKGNRIGDTDYIVMGQICIAKEYRGTGIFPGMYKLYFELYKPRYGCIITEVAARNVRSLKAHLNCGFEVIHSYIEDGFEEWIVVRY